MINRTIIGTLAATAITFFSCQDNGGEQTLAPKNMTIETKINAPIQSMATPGSFESGDKISIYAWTGSNTQIPPTGELIVNNSINTYQQGKWTAEPLMPWSDETTLHYFIGIHPSKAVTNLISDTYDESLDLLVATNLTGRSATNGNVPLEFDHVMSKLIVKLTFRNQFGGLTPTVSGVTSDIKAGATVNYLTKTATPLAAQGDKVSLSPILPNTSYSLIAAPQTVNKVYITIDGKVYTYHNESGFALESGKERTVELTVGADVVELAGVTVNEWGTSQTITGGQAQ